MARTQRWGDAPVHSIAVSLFQSKDQIHFFDEIGYEHNPYVHCPKGEGAWARGKCGCDPNRSFGAYFSLIRPRMLYVGRLIICAVS